MDLEQIGITKNRIEHRIGLPRLDRAVQVAGQIGGRQMKSVVVAVSAWRYGRCIGGPHVRCTKACCHQNRIGLPSFFNQLFIRSAKPNLAKQREPGTGQGRQHALRHAQIANEFHFLQALQRSGSGRRN